MAHKSTDSRYPSYSSHVTPKASPARSLDSSCPLSSKRLPPKTPATASSLKTSQKKSSSSTPVSVSSATSQDTICCVCLKNTESSHMVACEQCSHWSHSKCVGISISLAVSFPFVCPFCVKTIFSELLSIIRASISSACSRLSVIESSYSDLIPPAVQRELNRISDSLLHLSPSLSPGMPQASLSLQLLSLVSRMSQPLLLPCRQMCPPRGTRQAN